MADHWSKKQGKVTIGWYGGPIIGYNKDTGRSSEFKDREEAEEWLREQVKENDKREEEERKKFERLIQYD